ncbi:Methyltransferase domain-containing protein [Alkalibacterium subtropicum]|uniref:Methyltransferase domain-containing protein n=4 Tax=Lactobacillales TaxID=186826 RepID=A0A1M4S7V4_9LACT|nr:MULTISPECIES: methyltransferase domain-containing protein [Lactobacillales]MCI6735682.1 methyltransferase domain-containing protein [Aerococcus urinaeequi]MDN6146934.1 methyltransferase domain-containing protein [Tetragenococcus koreensis]MDN6572503.1 methyltransferase domain-containing protein [Staphylococcus equorum]AYW49682.1 methyltransferase domain-containing protein [Tetragenococcus halophilus]MCO8285466.1 methyltransferase domain-containing protein [Tetragenococcus halophilus]
MAGDNNKIKNRYNRVSKIYDLMEKPMESMLMDDWRKELFEKIEGKKILEVGVGTGKNLEFYSTDKEVTGIDFSEKMLEKAKNKSKDKDHVTLMEMDAENMTFEDNTFDTVVTSCVFCSVPDPVKGLKEIRRVCKNGGKVIMLEHMRSNKPVVGKIMDRINFIPLHIWGANINRQTLKNLQEAGFNKEDTTYKNVWSDVVKIIEIRNKK